MNATCAIACLLPVGSRIWTMRHCAIARAPNEKDSGHGGFGLRGKIEALMATEEGPSRGQASVTGEMMLISLQSIELFFWDGTIETFSSYLS
jgi:hypothetical protein